MATRSDEWRAVAVETEQKHHAARDLSVRSEGRLNISYYPTTCHIGEPDSEGHLYVGSVEDRDEDTFLWLDDRKDEPLPTQVVSELRRIAKWYGDLAADIEDRYEGGTEPKWEVALRYDDGRPEEVIAREPYHEWARGHVNGKEEHYRRQGAEIVIRRVRSKPVEAVA